MKKAIVLGLGISGKSVKDYLKNLGLTVYEVDKHNENDASILSLIHEVDILVKSPGIGWNHPLVVKAEGKVTSEIELGLMALQDRKKNILAITGSNGKTTTTMLTTHVLNATGRKAISCGNIGVPLLSCLENEADIIVLELSSYQLEKLQTRGLDAAVILNITPNHLDRYPSFSEYAFAKLHVAHLLKNNGKLYLHDDVIAKFKDDIPAYFSLPCLTIEENIASIFSLRYRDGRFSHDFDNFRASFALCREMGVQEKEFWEAAKSFVKPPHRLELVKVVNGVSFINDSKATSVDAVIKAVDSLNGDVILLCGGVDKGASYKQWGMLFKNKVKKAFLFGQARHNIYEEIYPTLDADILETLPEALEKAITYAKYGDFILLSPGCSSYDQFQSFEHRGEIFKTLVGKL